MNTFIIIILVLKKATLRQGYRAKQKRFYTRGTLRGIRFSRLAKLSTLYRDILELRKGLII
jgi:hypothetical protein